MKKGAPSGPENRKSEGGPAIADQPTRDNGRFVKGVSGNPGGKPKQENEIIRLCRDASPMAVQAIINILERDDASNQDKLRAAEFIVNRAYGKPRETVEATVKHSLEELVLASYRRAERLEQPAAPMIDVTPNDPD